MTDWYWVAGSDHNGQYARGGLHPMWHLPADDITVDQGRTDFETFLGLNPTTEETDSYWDKTYELVQRANLIVEKSGTANSPELGTEFLRNVRGEALFVRSLAYYNLWNFYRRIPLVTERINDRGATNTPVAEVRTAKHAYGWGVVADHLSFFG